MDVNPMTRQLAANLMDSPDFLALYDLTGPTNTPVWFDSEFYAQPTDAPNNANTGSVDFNGDRIYAASANNGIIACKVVPTVRFTKSANAFMLSWSAGYVLQSASSVEGPYATVNTTSPYLVNTANQAQTFYRLQKAP